MTPEARIRKSRDHWKNKAVSRATAVRELRKALDRERERRAAAELEVEKARHELGGTKAESRGSDGTTAIAGAAPIMTQEIRVICVLLAIKAVMPFRAVPRALKILQPKWWTPNFCSVINWTLRSGLALLNGVQKASTPWIAMIDMSIDVGKKSPGRLASVDRYTQ